MAITLRWISIPLAACVAIASLWSLRSELHRTADRIPTSATVLDARVVNASRVMSEWEAYVRYRVRKSGRDEIVENSVRIWTSFNLHNGDTIELLVDPATGDAEDDERAMSWLAAAGGLIAAAFLLLVGFGLIGRMLRRDRLSRDKGAL